VIAIGCCAGDDERGLRRDLRDDHGDFRGRGEQRNRRQEVRPGAFHERVTKRYQEDDDRHDRDELLE
jgi:hypothetical protein